MIKERVEEGVQERLQTIAMHRFDSRKSSIVTTTTDDTDGTLTDDCYHGHDKQYESEAADTTDTDSTVTMASTMASNAAVRTSTQVTHSVTENETDNVTNVTHTYNIYKNYMYSKKIKVNQT